MPSWTYFVLALLGLLAGYFFYGRLVERMFGADLDRRTPVCTLADGVDYVEMTPRRIFLIQLMNIAGPGPVFGPILGALYGPVALIWIVIGSIFAGAVHDYFSGMLSLRYMGKSLPDVVGATLGSLVRKAMRVFSVILLLLVGVVFVSGPAGLLANLTGLDGVLLIGFVFFYYFCATLLPIDKFIGRLYPFFALLLVVMAFSLLCALFAQDYSLYPSLNFREAAESDLPWWPLVFITITCGACSGFHATQSPMMARCINNERYGRFVFYGAMIAEGVLGLVWVTLGMSFYPDSAALFDALGPDNNAVLAVNEIAVELLGGWGGTLAILGVVVLPITTGDTAFRSVRLTMADALKLDQRPLYNRLKIAVPLLAVGVALTILPFGMLWNYFGLANQIMASIMLWTAAAYMIRRNRCHWVATVPAMFMTAVCVAYILFDATMGIQLAASVATGIGVLAALLCLGLLLGPGRSLNQEEDPLA